MLTIKNINKIVGSPIHKEWYIKNMIPIMRTAIYNHKPEELYKIVIRNTISGSVGIVYLNREFANGSIKRRYELYCERGSKRRVQLITTEDIKDMNELMGYIKVVAIDI